ncbi:3-keto-disaccharide hydrolase [Phenylobacterium sp.]|uniref:3-keto-disaccharide hydrolase n=1 Tax=Phenylobacterium sp. TaxID=1871053 RepID=UPI002FE41070
MKALLLGLALAACALGAQAQENTLTAAERAAGWKLLFDGRTTEGWRGFKAPAPDPGWTVKDGTLGPDPKTSKDIITRETFGDFELAFDWKISPKGNSGVMFRVVEEGDQTYFSGPEYQVLDNSRGEPPLERAGALYGLYPPSRDVTRPVGEFNQSRIVLRGGKGEHWLNGVKVVEYDLDSPEFKAKVAGTKFKAWPQFARSRSGHIALQNHGDHVAYRNIKIRPLD